MGDDAHAMGTFEFSRGTDAYSMRIAKRTRIAHQDKSYTVKVHSIHGVAKKVVEIAIKTGTYAIRFLGLLQLLLLLLLLLRLL